MADGDLEYTCGRSIGAYAGVDVETARLTVEQPLRGQGVTHEIQSEIPDSSLYLARDSRICIHIHIPDTCIWIIS